MLVLAPFLLCLGACGSSGETAAGNPPSSDDPNAGLPLEAGIHVEDARVVFRTEEFTLDPGQERFLCFAHETDQDLVLNGYGHGKQSEVHHIVLVRTTIAEPEGVSECDVLFRNSWNPLFITGAGASEFDFPDDVGHKLPQGTQIMAQLHLLNTGAQPITDSVAITMRRSTVAEPRPLGTYVFGSTNVELPANQPSTVTGGCSVKESVNVIAAFPHMHLLGTALTFEVGPSADQMQMVYQRNPYSFDDQRPDMMDLRLAPGQHTRVTCNYDNTLDKVVSYGESTTNEMCFLVGFATDREGLTGCFQ